MLWQVIVTAILAAIGIAGSVIFICEVNREQKNSPSLAGEEQSMKQK